MPKDVIVLNGSFVAKIGSLLHEMACWLHEAAAFVVSGATVGLSVYDLRGVMPGALYTGAS